MSDTPKSEVAKREEDILTFWKENDIFKKSLEKAAPNGDYIFYDGPPFATGLPHYGHIVASVIKDVVPRYWTMRGYHVPRRWGWDCHGLPIENIVEKELGFKHKKDILELGIAQFNELCRSKVLTYADEWKRIIPRVGRWADMDDPYFTMSRDFMESVWWAFKQLYDKGLVYEDYRSMHICPRCETTLSQSEVAEGYRDVKDIAVTVKFKLKNPEKIGLSGDAYMLAWTTTPWTLPGNVALAVGENLDYIKVRATPSVVTNDKKSDGSYHEPERWEYSYILAKAQLKSITEIARKSLVDFEVIGTIRGTDLVGLEYEPPFDYYVNDKSLKNHQNGWKVYAADFVTAESGTGIAHEAPAFGADDWELAKKVNLPFIQHVNIDGTFKSEVRDFAGMEVKSNSEDDKVRLGADIAAIKYLQEHGSFFSKENIVHPYPHCWRCDTPLLNYATSSWFVSVTKLKDDLLKNAENIRWSPEHIKEGRFGKWLEGARDWSISRQRFWASVIPIWVCDKCKKQRVFGSASELEEASGKKIHDLHKHIVDDVTFACECGGTMKRIPDVLDTWFDSGSMPYGQAHYPFENKEQFEGSFPAQFIAEGLDQTRAWFYYLHVLSGAIFHKNAFQNVIVNGIVLAEDGKKMSKKLQNYPDPMEVVEKYGADALRFYLMSSPVVQAENLSFSEKLVDDANKKNLGRLNNVLAFYKLYADGTARDFVSENILDRWILARLDELIRTTTDGFEKYQLDMATRPIAAFIDDLSVWYLRRSRDRFKEEGPDKRAALATLRYVLHRLSLVMAPAMPFFAEYLFQAVRESEDEESVHLASWPEASATPNFFQRLFGQGKESEKLLKSMQAARDLVTQALEVREKAGIPVKQPLPRLEIPKGLILVDVSGALQTIAAEVNVKNIEEGTRLNLDTSLTDELRAEGQVRRIIRYIQDQRKKNGRLPKDIIATPIQIRVSSQETVDTLMRYSEQIKKAVNAELIEFKADPEVVSEPAGFFIEMTD